MKFILVLVLWSNGDIYVLDHGLTKEDCKLERAFLSDMRELGELTCEEEQPK